MSAAEWPGVVTWAGMLATAVDRWEASAETAGYRGADMAGAARNLLAELAALWAPDEPAAGVLTSPGTPAAGAAQSTLIAGRPAVAEVWPVKFTGADKQNFAPWLAKCREAGAADTMTDAIRLAVRLASSIPSDQLPKMRAGNS